MPHAPKRPANPGCFCVTIRKIAPKSSRAWAIGGVVGVLAGGIGGGRISSYAVDRFYAGLDEDQDRQLRQHVHAYYQVHP